ncbi:hypothetical protein T439DRAFT_379611 [Meredithblackwellia eburnea MCA 4105]
MPSLIVQPQVTAAINFDIPEERLGHSKAIYEQYVEGRSHPTERIVVPLHDLRVEQNEDGTWSDMLQQVETRGFAAFQHQSKHIGPEIDTPEGIEAYISEIAELFKANLGATKVMGWNTVMRRNDPSSFVPKVEARQQKPEKGLPPSRNVKVTASAAHIDQDEEYGRTICKRAAGENVFEKYRRVQIVNLWRPLKGPVTNAPLALCDSRTVNVKDLSVHASPYGTGLGITHNTEQRWAYISRQMPNEVFVLKCYDSLQGKNGASLWAPHVACSEVFGETELQGPLEPRFSVEARMVLFYE